MDWHQCSVYSQTKSLVHKIAFVDNVLARGRVSRILPRFDVPLAIDEGSHYTPYIVERSNPMQYVWWETEVRCVPRRWRHLTFNAVAQLVAGVPLELMHGPVRTAVIYIAGILTGMWRRVSNTHVCSPPYKHFTVLFLLNSPIIRELCHVMDLVVWDGSVQYYASALNVDNWLSSPPNRQKIFPIYCR